MLLWNLIHPSTFALSSDSSSFSCSQAYESQTANLRKPEEIVASQGEDKCSIAYSCRYISKKN